MTHYSVIIILQFFTVRYPLHSPSPTLIIVRYVGSHSIMAALDVGCARTPRPHWYAYALVNGRAIHENFFISYPCLSFFPLFPPSSFFLFTSSPSLSFHHRPRPAACRAQINYSSGICHLFETTYCCLSSPSLRTLRMYCLPLRIHLGSDG